MKRTCAWCGTPITLLRADARFCSAKCRVYAHRAKLPRQLIEQPRWVRHQNKRPITIDGRPASVTDPTTWNTYGAARKAQTGTGLGYVLGDGIGCIDLDHCITPTGLTTPAQDLVDRHPDNYIEISPSGDGLHIWVGLDEQPGTRTTINEQSVEIYSRERYITITGNVYQHGTIAPL